MQTKKTLFILFLYIALWIFHTGWRVDAQLQEQLLWSDTDTRVNILRQHIHADKDLQWEDELKKLKEGIQVERRDAQKVNKQSKTTASLPNLNQPQPHERKFSRQSTTMRGGGGGGGNISETTLYVDMLNRLAKTGGNLMELVEGIRKAVELQGNQDNLIKVDEAIDHLLTSLHNVPLSLSLPKLIDSQPITSIVHVSCGNQMHWMNSVLQLRPQIRYMGLDSRDATLVWLRSKYYGHPNIQFRTVEWQYMLPQGYQLLVAINALSPLELQQVYSFFFSAAKYAGFEYFFGQFL
ncbi:hypothetical protein Gasu2_35580 [Galdieria sulphuraria]|nr:hypothetical protein Gasu2_35580 [Galdieria sulphuraria]